MTAVAGVGKRIHLSDPHLVQPGERLFGLDPAARLRAAFDAPIDHAGVAVQLGDRKFSGFRQTCPI